MKQILNQGFRFLAAFLIIFLSSINTTLATNYGEGSYGGGNYNVGETTSAASVGAPNCIKESPSSAPFLYAAIPQDSTSILLQFTEAGNPVDSYTLRFGTTSGDYDYGADNIGSQGTKTYLVNSLKPNTTYFFSVRAGNGCATGAWSNELSAKTISSVNFNQLKTVDFKLEPLDNNNTEKEVTGHEVTITVTTDTGEPIKGARVTIHSKVQEAITDENGIARFNDVEPGDHKVLVAYDGYQGEQSISLDKEVKQFNLSIKVTPTNPFKSKPVIITISILTAIILGFLLYIAYSKQERKFKPRS